MGEETRMRAGIHLHARNRMNGVIVGLFLIGIGALFLMQKLGAADWVRVDRLWPVVFYVLAASQIVEGKLGGAVGFALFGTWFFACIFHWWGLTYGNSWPVLLVAVGASMAIGALTGEDDRRRRDEDPS